MKINQIIDNTPKTCRALVILLIVGISSVSTVAGYLYFANEKEVKKIHADCNKELHKKDEIILRERVRNEMIIDSILNQQKEQIKELLKVRRNG